MRFSYVARTFFVAFCLLGTIFLVGCSANKINEYKGREPEFKPEEYFDGHVKARAIFENRNGKVTREFTGDFRGDWDGESLTIDERLEYKSGKTKERTWVFEKEGENEYRLSAENIIGEGRGTAMGNAMHLEYTTAVDVDGSTWNLTADDWMYRQGEKTVINRTTLTYWWLKAGELTIVYRKME